MSEDEDYRYRCDLLPISEKAKYSGSYKENNYVRKSSSNKDLGIALSKGIAAAIFIFSISIISMLLKKGAK